MIDALFQDVRYAIRQLRRAPGLAFAVVVTLALAIGAGTALFSLLNAVVLRRLPVRDPDRLVVLSLTDQRGQATRLINYRTYADFVAQQSVFESLCAYSGGGIFAVETRGAVVDAGVAAITAECFSVLGLRPSLGRLIESGDAPGTGEPGRVVVLGYRFWQRAFNGDPNAVGDRLVVDGAPLTVVGILPREFPGLHVDSGSDFYVPLTLLVRLSGDPKRPVRAYNIIGRLRAGVTLEQARAAVTSAWPALQANTLPAGLSPAEQNEVRAQRVQVDSGASGFSFLRQRYATPLVTVVALAGLLLLIACVNLSGLLLARAIARNQQLAVCLALGATRLRVARLLMVESLLLSTTGTLAAVPLAWAACRAIAAELWGGVGVVPLAMSVTPDARVLGTMGAVAVVTGLVVGVLPAVAGSHNEPHHALQRGRTLTSSTRRWAKSLLVVQVALSLVLLFGAGLFTTSLARLRSIDSGFRPDGILFTRAWQQPGPRRTYDEQAYYPALVERLSALPGVRSVALSHYFPAYFNFPSLPMHAMSRTDAADRHGDVEGLTEFISPRFFQTVGATILRGRDFTWADRAGSPGVVIINQALERKLFPNGDAIGQRIRIGAEARRQAVEVVGIATDVTVANLRSPHLPVAFRPRMQEPQYMRVPGVILDVSGNIQAVGSALGPAIRSMGQEYVRRVFTLEEQIDISLLQERLLAGLSSFFAGLAALLAFVGLYALLAHAVARRAREIGLRMAIGASRASVVAMVVREAMGLTLLGVALGVPCALAAGRLTGALVYGVDPSDPRALVAAAALFVVIGALAALLPARRASSIDPMTALRCE